MPKASYANTMNLFSFAAAISIYLINLLIIDTGFWGFGVSPNEEKCAERDERDNELSLMRV